MKLRFNVEGKCQPDPFIFEDEGRFYLYVSTYLNGVSAYSADDIFGEWKYEGIIGRVDEECDNYWAPAVIKYNGRYYMYVSCSRGEEMFEYLHVLVADSPLGPFKDAKCLYNFFSIDPHVVETEAGLFLLYAQDNTEGERIGTRVYIDKLIDPYTPANICKELIVPTFDEEIFTPKYSEDCRWHTVEGPFWFKEGEWQYIMYSAGCFEDDTYHIGYVYAKTDEPDLMKIDFVKKTNNGTFSPVIIKNSFEEGTGHHSVIKHGGEYYAIYHARDYGMRDPEKYVEARTARVCKIKVNDGEITAEMYEDRV